MRLIYRQTLLTMSLLVLACHGRVIGQTLSLENGWAHPPREARLRAYWWWLNGCVTKASITRDLEEMKDKGFGGALICDADGSSQDGNDRAPHGPTFFSPEWRELYRHALREANRLGLEMSLNIQSGWNLGGPIVTADDAAKKLVWSEVQITGPADVQRELPEPQARDGYYRDAMVVAYPIKPSADPHALQGKVSASSQQSGFPIQQAADGDPETYWVSAGNASGSGPSRENPVWLQVEFREPTALNRLTIRPRPQYGPRDCELRVTDDGKTFRPVKAFTVDVQKETTIAFEPVTGRVFRLVIFGAFDRGSFDAPRNVQIAEVALEGADGAWPDHQARRRGILHWRQKAVYAPLSFSRARHHAAARELSGSAG